MSDKDTLIALTSFEIGDRLNSTTIEKDAVFDPPSNWTYDPEYTRLLNQKNVGKKWTRFAFVETWKEEDAEKNIMEMSRTHVLPLSKK